MYKGIEGRGEEHYSTGPEFLDELRVYVLRESGSTCRPEVNPASGHSSQALGLEPSLEQAPPSHSHLPSVVVYIHGVAWFSARTRCTRHDTRRIPRILDTVFVLGSTGTRGKHGVCPGYPCAWSRIHVMDDGDEDDDAPGPWRAKHTAGPWACTCVRPTVALY